MHSWNLVIIPGIMRTSGARQATQIGVRLSDFRGMAPCLKNGSRCPVLG